MMSFFLAMAWALTVMVTVGCSVESPPVTLYPGVAPDPGEKAAVEVLPLEDLRPEDEREGKEPKLITLLIWNQRIGDYVTGSASFEDDVSRAVTSAVAETISKGAMGKARVRWDLTEHPGQSLAESCGDADARWLLSGSIDDLYATLHQKAYFWIIPTPWAGAAGWGNDKTDPLGVARLTVRLFDCHKKMNVLERQFRAEDHYPNATLAEAAKEALNETLSRFSDSLRVLAVEIAAERGEPPLYERAGTTRLAEVGDQKTQPVGSGSDISPAAVVDLDLVPLPIKYDSRFPHKFSLSVVIDGEEDIILDPDTEVVRHLPKTKHLLRIVDKKRGFFHKPDWADYEMMLDLETLDMPKIIIKSHGWFRVSITVKVYSDQKEVDRYKIKTSM